MKRKELPFEELLETWNDDKSSGEYIGIDDKDNAYYHGKLIAPAKREKVKEGFHWRETGATAGIDWETIRAWCDKQQFWPNVWQSNDHGNVSLYTLRGQYLGGIV